ncbi:MAG: aspartate/glutamate racemase family protein [Pseudomonadota bacterium]
MALIRVLNPNSNQDVTDGLADALFAFEIPGRIEITCETLESGPYGIESQRDVDSVAVPVVDRMKAHPADAHVIACYSDPGLALARAEVPAPVFGIQESAIAMALTRGERFGVIAIADASIPRHLHAIRTMGVEARLAAERALNLTVAETTGDAVFDRLAETGAQLCKTDGADVLILGCAGMARHRARLAAELECPVIDPAQAAVTHAIGVVLAS